MTKPFLDRGVLPGENVCRDGECPLEGRHPEHDFEDHAAVEQSLNTTQEGRLGVLRRKLGVARGMLVSAHGVLEGSLPREDCTPEEIQQALDETEDDGGEWTDSEEPIGPLAVHEAGRTYRGAEEFSILRVEVPLGQSDRVIAEIWALRYRG